MWDLPQSTSAKCRDNDQIFFNAGSARARAKTSVKRLIIVEYIDLFPLSHAIVKSLPDRTECFQRVFSFFFFLWGFFLSFVRTSK